MASENQAFPRLNKASLYQLIAMHRTQVEPSSISAVFGQKRQKRITTLLTQLKAEGKIRENARGYRAVVPWADLALGIVGPLNQGRRVKLDILNLPEKVKLNVSISRSNAGKHLLKEGERIVVSLTRGPAERNELRAGYIAHANTDTPLHLSGYFNAFSGLFTTYNHGLKSKFKIAQEPEKNTNLLRVELPQNFDMRRPILKTSADQTFDREIIRIIARPNEIALAHPQDILSAAGILASKPLLPDGRVDLRDLDFVTVDPLNAQDLDDAMCARVENNGYALYTAIADVPYFLPYLHIVDRDAYHRGLTHYLFNGDFAPMLPSMIAARCSLVPHEDRAAIVVKQIFGSDFRLKGFEIFPAIIQSKEKLSYGQFYDLLERNDPRFKVLATIYDTHRRQGLDKNLQAFLSTMPDTAPAKAIVQKVNVDANTLAAQYLSQRGKPYLSRIYPQNPAGRTQDTEGGARACYAPFRPDHEGMDTYYAHISSPIRRYGDNINIRALHACFNTPGLGIDEHQIARLGADAAHLNTRRDTNHNIMQQIERYHSLEQAKKPGLTPA